MAVSVVAPSTFSDLKQCFRRNKTAATDMQSDRSNVVYCATFAVYFTMLSVQKFAVADVTLQGHSRALQTVCFDRGHTISY